MTAPKTLACNLDSNAVSVGWDALFWLEWTSVNIPELEKSQNQTNIHTGQSSTPHPTQSISPDSRSRPARDLVRVSVQLADAGNHEGIPLVRGTSQRETNRLPRVDVDHCQVEVEAYHHLLIA